MGDLIRVHRAIEQTRMLIGTDMEKAVEAATKAVYTHRAYLEDYIRNNSIFYLALAPLDVEDDAPEIVRRMASAAEAANVGPMAAVAGAIADLAVEAMSSVGARVKVVENGGEIAADSDRPIKLGVYSGTSPISGKIGFQLDPSDTPIGVGTSSATVGEALSLGEADSATVFAGDAALADAAATAVGNSVRGDDIQESIRRGLEMARSIDGVRGALVVRGRHVGSVGKIPKLIKVDSKYIRSLEGLRFLK